MRHRLKTTTSAVIGVFAPEICWSSSMLYAFAAQNLDSGQGNDTEIE
jgi:hypothetical protein